MEVVLEMGETKKQELLWLRKCMCFKLLEFYSSIYLICENNVCYRLQTSHMTWKESKVERVFILFLFLFFGYCVGIEVRRYDPPSLL